MTQSQHHQIDDETLSAFLAGTLPDEQSLQIEQALNNDESLATRAEQLTQADPLASLAYQDLLREPIPSHLRDTVWQNKTQQTDSNVIKLPAQRRASGYLPMATAASIALLIGGLLGQQLIGNKSNSHRLAQADAGVIVAQNPLYTALEQTPSQHHFEAGNGDIILPVMSFQANDGRYCREFQINADSKVSVGVACKQDGYWSTEILLAAGTRPHNTLSYQPAAGYSQPALDAVLGNLWNGIAFDQHEEQVLIQQAWF